MRNAIERTNEETSIENGSGFIETNRKWIGDAQLALHLALSSPSRHYAGRSLQIFRGLRVPITSRMLTDILSRLVETAAEQGEDMQVLLTAAENESDDPPPPKKKKI